MRLNAMRVRLRCHLSSPILQRNILIVFTFFVFAPMACNQLLYSYYYSHIRHLDIMTKQFLDQNLEEAHAAVRYFNHLLPSMNSTLVPSLLGEAGAKPWLVVTIITVHRKPEYHYLMQVASRVHRLLVECGDDCSRNHLFICNVNQEPGRHKDAKLLDKVFRTTERNSTAQSGTNHFEKEKCDYTFCLEQTLLTFDPEYVLLVEDDAVPEEDLFRVINQLLLVRFPETPLGGGLYFKLFHPERLQHYLNPEPMRILEWVGLGMLAGTILAFLYNRATGRPHTSWRAFLFFALYSMVLAELVGRHYLLELRRLSPSLYNVVPVTECCTQAMLYSASSARRVLQYLAEMKCKPGFAKDIALYSILRQTEEWAFVVEPNLVRHVGLFSSLPRGAMNPKLL